MKIFRLICIVLATTLLFTACSSPKKTANEFRDALLKKDFEKAAALTEMANVETILVVETYRLFYDDLKSYDIEKIKKTSDSTAVATIHVVHETEAGDVTENGNLNFIKKNGNWLINY